MLRIAIYARVSTTDKGQDAKNQLRELRQFVVNKSSEDWSLAGEYVDQASGKNANRPEFQRLFVQRQRPRCTALRARTDNGDLSARQAPPACRSAKVLGVRMGRPAGELLRPRFPQRISARSRL